MRRHLHVLLALLTPALVASETSAQVREASAVPVHASAAVGRVDGIVTDTSGVGVERVSVLALGTALAIARTDDEGRFSLSLPPGQYILRAARDGYISTYREAIRIHSDVLLTRAITLVRAAVEAQPDAAGAGSPDAVTGPEPADDHAHSPTAWRLRHLARTVLRDGTELGLGGENQAPEGDSAAVSWVALNSARAATTFFGQTDFNGQVNFLATSALSATGMPERSEWGRGVAYVVVGAPVGTHGDWSVRAALAPGEPSSWAFLGEYQARREQSHAFRAGVSYSAQTHETFETERLPVAAPSSTRRVGGFYGSDSWTIRPGVQIEYGLEIDRYDYLADPALVSGRLGVRARVAPGVAVTLGTAPRMVAPGAEQFFPPEARGPWLPPERTFDGLDGGPLLPERIEYYEVGLDAQVTAALVATIRAFSEETTDQIATLFGVEGESPVGHYYVGSPGSVDVAGVSMELSGQFSENVRGRVTYTRTVGRWHDGGDFTAMSPLATSLLRRSAERGHDLSAALEATVPDTATRINVAYRLSNLYGGWRSTPEEASRVDGRFKVEVRQQLPYKPMRNGELNVLLAARTLLRDLGRESAFYDELLTVAPPVQVTCGLQMRF